MSCGDSRAPGRGGFKFHVGTAELRRAGRNGGRKRHGGTIVYIDGKPVSLQRVAADTGLKVEVISKRARAARDRGEAVTMDYLTKPLQLKSPRKPVAMSGYVVRKALR